MSCHVSHIWLTWSLTLSINSELLWNVQWSSETCTKWLGAWPAKQLSNVQDFNIFQFVLFRWGNEWMNTYCRPQHLQAATTPLHLFPLPPTISLQLQLLSTHSPHSQQLSTVLPSVLQQALSARYCNQLLSLHVIVINCSLCTLL